MVSRIFSFWRDERGGAGADWAIVLGLLTVAAVAWLTRIGGQDGVADALATLSWHIREIGRFAF